MLKHKPGAQYKPTLVSIGNSRNEPIREIEEDVDYDEDDIEGLHMSSTTLSNGSVVMSGDWVLFKVDGKNCIGLYLKSVGYICQIDSCQLLGDGRYGWPCHCRKDTDPGYCVMLICEDERPSCKAIKFKARNDIVCKFNHPMLTRRGFLKSLHMFCRHCKPAMGKGG